MAARHFGARVRDFIEAGRRVIALENELVRVELLPDKGSDIVSFVHKRSDTDVLWQSSAGLQPPMPGGRRPASGVWAFLDEWEGGWQECLPNGGPGVTYRGAEIPFHGELWASRWDVDVEVDTPEVVTVALSIETPLTPFRVEKRLSLRSGSSALIIDETVHNLSSGPIELMWGQHPAFGAPFLDDSCRIDLPDCEGSTRRSSPLPTSTLEFDHEFRWPHARLNGGGTLDLSVVPPEDAGRSEWVCLRDFDEGWYGITSGRKQVGFGLRWDASLFPYMWFWQVWGGEPDAPWWGREYVCALEPWTSWPDSGLLEAIDNGSALTLAGDGTLETRFIAVVYSGRDRIEGIDESGDVY